MVYRDKTKVVDSFTTLRATQLHGRTPRYSSRKPDPPPAPSASGGRKPGVHIGHTVMPTQNRIVCYSCGFEFVMRGRAESTQCPKCGARLGLNDHTITGAYAEELITAGKVHLTRGAILDGGKIVANDVLLEGTVKSGSLRAYQTLELTNTAVIPEEMLTARNLRIGNGAVCVFRNRAEFRDVDIVGELSGDLWADGVVTIRAGGRFTGQLHAEHLVVEEGGGLQADVVVQSAHDEESGIAPAEHPMPKPDEPVIRPPVRSAPPIIRL